MTQGPGQAKTATGEHGGITVAWLHHRKPRTHPRRHAMTCSRRRSRRCKANHRRSGGRPCASLFLPEPSHEVTLSQWYALPTQDVVRGRRMKVEVGLREGKQKLLGRKVDVTVPEGKAHVAADECVNLSGVNRLESRESAGDPL